MFETLKKKLEGFPPPRIKAFAYANVYYDPPKVCTL